MVIFCDSFLLIEMSFTNGVTLCRPTPKLYIENLPSSLSLSRVCLTAKKYRMCRQKLRRLIQDTLETQVRP